VRFGSGWSWLKIVPVWIGLMSGVFSVFREIVGIYFPRIGNAESMFWSWTRITFIVSAFIVWWQMRQEIKKLAEENERLRRDESAATRPQLTEREQSLRSIVRDLIAGSTKAELRVLHCILDHGEIEQYQLDRAVQDRGAVASALEKWRHTLIGETVEIGTNRTSYSIVAGRRSALEAVLGPLDSP